MKEGRSDLWVCLYVCAWLCECACVWAEMRRQQALHEHAPVGLVVSAWVCPLGGKDFIKPAIFPTLPLFLSP